MTVRTYIITPKNRRTITTAHPPTITRAPSVLQLLLDPIEILDAILEPIPIPRGFPLAPLVAAAVVLFVVAVDADNFPTVVAGFEDRLGRGCCGVDIARGGGGGKGEGEGGGGEGLHWLGYWVSVMVCLYLV